MPKWITIMIMPRSHQRKLPNPWFLLNRTQNGCNRMFLAWCHYFLSMERTLTLNEKHEAASSPAIFHVSEAARTYVHNVHDKYREADTELVSGKLLKPCCYTTKDEWAWAWIKRKDLCAKIRISANIRISWFKTMYHLSSIRPIYGFTFLFPDRLYGNPQRKLSYSRGTSRPLWTTISWTTISLQYMWPYAQQHQEQIWLEVSTWDKWALVCEHPISLLHERSCTIANIFLENLRESSN